MQTQSAEPKARRLAQKDAHRKSAQQRLPQAHWTFVLRCCVYRRGRWYYGECIDLDIIVRGADAESACASLNQAVYGYMRAVLEGLTEKEIQSLKNTGEVAGLLPRRSPWTHRLHYHWLLLKAALTIGSERNFRIFDCMPDRICAA